MSLERSLKEILKKKVSELTEEDKEILRKWLLEHRSRRSIAVDLRYGSKRVPVYASTWYAHQGKRYDIPGVDTPEALPHLEKLGYHPRTRKKKKQKQVKTESVPTTVKPEKEEYEKLTKELRLYNPPYTVPPLSLREKAEKFIDRLLKKYGLDGYEVYEHVLSGRKFVKTEDDKSLYNFIIESWIRGWNPEEIIKELKPVAKSYKEYRKKIEEEIKTRAVINRYASSITEWINKYGKKSGLKLLGSTVYSDGAVELKLEKYSPETGAVEYYTIVHIKPAMVNGEKKILMDIMFSKDKDRFIGEQSIQYIYTPEELEKEDINKIITGTYLGDYFILHNLKQGNLDVLTNPEEALEHLKKHHVYITKEQEKQIKELIKKRHTKPTAVGSEKVKVLPLRFVDVVFPMPSGLDEHLEFVVFPNGQVVQTHYYHRELGIGGEYGKLVSGFNVEPHYELKIPVGSILVVVKKEYEKEPVHGIRIEKPVPQYYYVDEKGKVHKIEKYDEEEKILEKMGDSKLILRYHVIETPYGKIRIPYKLYGTGKLAYNIDIVYYPVAYSPYTIRNALKLFREASKYDILYVDKAYKGINIYPSTDEAREKIIKELEKHGIRYHSSVDYNWRTNRYKVYIYIPEYMLYKHRDKIIEILDKHGADKKDVSELVNEILEYDIPFYKIAEQQLKDNLGEEILSKIKIEDVDLFKSWYGTDVDIRIRGYNKLSKDEKEKIKSHYDVSIIDRKGEGVAELKTRLPYSSVRSIPLGTWLYAIERDRFEKLYNDIKKRNKDLTEEYLAYIIDHVEEKLKQYKKFYQYLFSGEYNKIHKLVDRYIRREAGYYTEDYEYHVLDNESLNKIVDLIIDKYRKPVEEAKKESSFVKELLSDKRILQALDKVMTDYYELYLWIADKEYKDSMLVDPSRIVAIVDKNNLNKYFGHLLDKLKPIDIGSLKKKDDDYIAPDGTRYPAFYVEPLLRIKPDIVMNGKGLPLVMRKGNLYFLVAPRG